MTTVDTARRPTDEEKYTAYHEAGQAVVGCIGFPELKRRLSEIFITPDPPPIRDTWTPGDWRGYAFFPHDDPNADPGDEPPDMAYAYLVQAAAGKISEMEIGGNPTPNPKEFEDDEDMIDYFSIVYNPRALPADIDALIACGRSDARQLVLSHRGLITKVTARLLSQPLEMRHIIDWNESGNVRYLTGDGVRQMIPENTP